MFRPTSRQVSMLESQFVVSPDKRVRLEKSWAHAFQTKVLPLIDEELFRDGFDEGAGRPNKSIRLLMGVHLLKEWDDLTDEQVLEYLEYNVQWHYALAEEPSTAHACQKTLHNFRVRLMENERSQQMFERITRGLVELDGLGVGRQRLDSTHVLSNIAVLTRLGLFVETVTTFLKELRRSAAEDFEALPEGYGRRYLDREGYFSDAKKEQARRRLPLVAQDLYRLVRRFADHAEVRALDSYSLLVRLLDEQCEVVEGTGEAESAGPSAPPVLVRGADGSWRGAAAGSEAEPAQEGGEAAEGEVAESTPDHSAEADPADGVDEAIPGPAESPSSESADTPPADDPDGGASAPESGKLASGGDRGRTSGAGGEPDGTAPATLEQGGEADRPREPASTTDPSPAGDEEAGCGDEPSPPDETATPPEPGVMLKEPKSIAASSLQSPHDSEATYGHKGKGYEVQVSETCSKGNPYQVITAVSVNGAHESDQHATVPIVDALQQRGLGPDELLADTGYGSGENLVTCAERGVHLVAPVQDPRVSPGSDRWNVPADELSGEPSLDGEARDPGTDAAKLGLEAFRFNATFNRVASCPEGVEPVRQEVGERHYQATFPGSRCGDCPLADRCPTRILAGTEDRRLYWRDAQAATATRQREQREPTFRERYKLRSGIESTNSVLKGPRGADSLRIRGKQRVELSMVLKATAENVWRAVRFHATKLAAAIESAQGEATANA
jgi:hypothetical protein